jgi:hypothetical protein
MRYPILILLSGLLGAATACSDPNSLADPTVKNYVATSTLYALSGTPLTTPSAFSIPLPGTVLVQTTSAFDFAYEVTDAGQPVFLPLRVLGLSTKRAVNPGFIRTAKAFSSISEAPSNGYVTNDSIAVAVDDVFIGRSRLACSIGVPVYAKFHILGLDPVARSVTFEWLVDNNCGYRGLTPGLPKN